MVDDFTKFASGAREGMIKVSALLKSTEAIGGDLKQFVASFSGLLGDVVLLQASLRPGSTFKLERCILDKFISELKYLKALVISGVYLDDDLMSQLVEILAMAQASWMENSVIEEFQDWAIAERALKVAGAR